MATTTTVLCVSTWGGFEKKAFDTYKAAEEYAEKRKGDGVVRYISINGEFIKTVVDYKTVRFLKRKYGRYTTGLALKTPTVDINEFCVKSNKAYDDKMKKFNDDMEKLCKANGVKFYR